MEFLNTMDPVQLAGLSVVVGIIITILGIKLFTRDYKYAFERSESLRIDDLSKYVKSEEELEKLTTQLSSQNKNLAEQVVKSNLDSIDLEAANVTLLELNLELAVNHLNFTKAYTQHIIGDKEAAYAFILHLDKDGVSDTKKLEMLRTLTDDMAVITNGSEDELHELVTPGEDCEIDDLLEDNTAVLEDIEDSLDNLDPLDEEEDLDDLDSLSELDEIVEDDLSDIDDNDHSHSEEVLQSEDEIVVEESTSENNKFDEGSTVEDMKKSEDANHH